MEHAQARIRRQSSDHGSGLGKHTQAWVNATDRVHHRSGLYLVVHDPVVERPMWLHVPYGGAGGMRKSLQRETTESNDSSSPSLQRPKLSPMSLFRSMPFMPLLTVVPPLTPCSPGRVCR